MSVEMVDTIFDLCVVLLLFLADLLGMTYKAINVWIFVVIWPVFTLALVVVVVRQQLKIRKLLKLLDELAEENHQGVCR
jgi:hypothetical protein